MADDPELKAMAAIKAALEPLDPETRGYVLRWAVERFNVPVTLEELGGNGQSGGGRSEEPQREEKRDIPPMSVFLKEHPTKTQAESVAVLTAWDNLKNGTEAFAPDSIESLWKKSGWKKSGNINQAILKANTEGWLDKKERGKYEVTSYGVKHVLEELVQDDDK